ncbi:MAG: discoidin domain-containing protein, partial [Bacteroidales bacterium]|nr:discoidin domain-containing protein [Bacteroidales bacterium]
VYDESNPFSFKPGGFIGGAGHGHTFKDKYGNYWHVATMKVSIRHMFERRLGLFPVFISKNGHWHAHTVWTDYPFIIPDEKTDFEKNDGFAGWNMLSFRKPVTASSALEGHEPAFAADERIETGWSAQTGNAGEWFQVDLGKNREVYAVQVNFADHDFTMRAPHPLFACQYVVEASDDGQKWTVIIDKSAGQQDAVHDLTVLARSVVTRYLRITNCRELPGKFSLYDFRIFGQGKGKVPGKVTGISVQRNPDDPRRFHLSWDKQANADGYVVHAKIKGGQTAQSVMVYDNEFEGGFFNRDSEYEFTVEAFNENGR